MSQILPNGFGNLYLTALANCPPGSPFFPVAYHQGGPAHFAIAVESADIALQAIQSASTLGEARQNLIEAIETAAFRLSLTAQELANTYQIPFSGIDFSLAPFPTDDKSLGGALEALAAAIWAAQAASLPLVLSPKRLPGPTSPAAVSGLMLPVLEDAVLARRAAEGVLTVSDLLSYSAVCGVGLDTIPLPGEVSEGR